MLKSKIVQILSLQIHQNYAKYTFQTFTVNGMKVSNVYLALFWCIGENKISKTFAFSGTLTGL
jgi:hypothetical protein